MKRQNSGKFIGFLMVVLIAAIITAALVAGYRFLRYTNREAAQKIDDAARNAFGAELEPYEYKEQSSRTYTGKRLYESCGYIYNDQGEMLTQFHENDSYGLDVAFDVDRKRGAFVYNGKGYIINSDLEIEKTIDNCSDIGISYEGVHVIYSSSPALYIYDCNTHEETQITDRGFNPIISPNGESVVYTGFKDHGVEALYIGGVSKEQKELASGDEDSIIRPLAVSDDGLTVYYDVTFGDSDGIYVYHDESNKRISEESSATCYFDRKCETLLASDRKEAFYYDTSLKEKKVLVDKGYLRDICVFNTDVCKMDIFEKTFVVDTDCFSDVVMIFAGPEVYCLWGAQPKAVLLTDEGVLQRYSITKEGPACLYFEDDKLIKSEIVKGEAVKTDLIEDAMYLEVFEMKKDFSGGFYVKREKEGAEDYIYRLYSFIPGEDPKVIAESKKMDMQSLKWDNLFKKCYYISDENLYSINDDGTGKKLIGGGYYMFGAFYGGDEVPVIEDKNLDEFLIINGKIYEK